MVTPFHDDGSLDLDGAVALAGWLLEHGNDGLVLAGTTGEAPTLSDDEAVELEGTPVSSLATPQLTGTAGGRSQGLGRRLWPGQPCHHGPWSMVHRRDHAQDLSPRGWRGREGA